MSEKNFIDLRTASHVHIEHGTNFIFIEMDDVQIAVSNQMAQFSPLTKVQDMGNST